MDRLLMLAFGLLCLAVGLSVGSSPGYPDPQFYNDLSQTEEYLHDVALEKVHLLNRVLTLKSEKTALIGTLQKILDTTIPHIIEKQRSQDERLVEVKGRIKSALHRIADKEADLAGQYRQAQRLEENTWNRWTQINNIQESDNVQDAQLAKIKFQLQATKEKLYQKLLTSEARSMFAVGEVNKNADETKTFIDYRKCVSMSAVLPVNGTGRQSVDIPDVFHGQIPVATCVSTGFAAHVNLKEKNPHQSGYVKVEDRYSEFAGTIDCKAYESYVDLFGFDTSRGFGNAWVFAYVDIKVCSLGPLVLPH